MGIFSRIFFSREHVGRSSGEKEWDVYRRDSDKSKPEKIGHCKANDGYGKDSVKVNVNVKNK